MRKISIHQGDLLNDQIILETYDDDKPDLANSKFQFHIKSGTNWEVHGQPVKFHSGPLGLVDEVEYHINGLSNEVFLAIVLDRLQSWQKGKYACKENEVASQKILEALFWLKHHNQELIQRGTFGRLVP